jgi:hypothetical protein
MKKITQKNLILVLLLILTGSIMQLGAQTTITGQITDSIIKTTLPGVNILIKGTTKGTVSDADGKFTIAVPSSKDVLVFSYIGYVTKEVEVGNSSRIDLALSPEIINLDEVVVMGYSTKKRSYYTVFR